MALNTCGTIFVILLILAQTPIRLIVCLYVRLSLCIWFQHLNSYTKASTDSLTLFLWIWTNLNLIITECKYVCKLQENCRSFPVLGENDNLDTRVFLIFVNNKLTWSVKGGHSTNTLPPCLFLSVLILLQTAACLLTCVNCGIQFNIRLSRMCTTTSTVL